MPMKNPLHPGRILLRDCIEVPDLAIAKAARHLLVPEERLRVICRREAPITADTRLRLQSTNDLALARKSAWNIKRIERAT